MYVVTSEHRAVTRENLRLIQQNEGLRKHNLGLLLENKELRQMNNFVWHYWKQLASWYMNCCAILRRYKDEREWGRQVLANDLDPRDTVLVLGLREVLRDKQIDENGMARVYRSELQRATNLKGDTLDRARKSLLKGGTTREYSGAFDPKTGEAYLLMGFNPDAQAAPQEQEKPADAPIRGGNHRHRCESCGKDTVAIEQKITMIYTCKNQACKDYNVPVEEEAAPTLVYYPDLGGEPSPDRWEQNMQPWRTEWANGPAMSDSDFWAQASTSLADEETRGERVVKQEMAHMRAPLTMPSRAPQTRQVDPCPLCGGIIERLRMERWVCVGCLLKQAQKGA